MKGLYKAISVGLVSVPLLFGGCSEKKAKEYTNLQGTVFSERYMPATAGGFMNSSKESRYSFSIDTQDGRTVFQVESTRDLSKESLDALVDPGTKVEVQIEKGTEGQTGHTVLANRIKVLKE